MLKTQLCERLGIEHPILSAGFGPGAGPDVVAAVSNAGGCGVLGASGFSVPYLRELIGRVRALTTRPFGVNLILEDIAEGPIEACLESNVPLPGFFLGHPRPYVEPCHAAAEKPSSHARPRSASSAASPKTPSTRRTSSTLAGRTRRIVYCATPSFENGRPPESLRSGSDPARARPWEAERAQVRPWRSRNTRA